MAADDECPGRALLTAVLAMVGVAVLVGLAVGVVAVTAVHMSGLEPASGTAKGPPQTLYMPKYHPTKAAGDGLGLPSQSPTPSLSLSPSGSASPTATGIRLFDAPQKVKAGGRINFNGVYNGGEGVALQIQRKQGGTWTDFPVTATVRGGSFETWIQTTQTGLGRFRVFDKKANLASNVVTVQIG
jgi:hypothetical protein